MYSKQSRHFLKSFSTNPQDVYYLQQVPQHILVSVSTYELLASLQWVTQHMAIPADNGLALAQQIQTSAVFCITDGSFKHEYGTAAFILVDGNHEQDSWIGVTPCYRDSSIHDAYQSELTGVLAMVSTLLIICKRFHINDGIIHIGCDNDTALACCLDDN